jgi:hypothetical protein
MRFSRLGELFGSLTWRPHEFGYLLKARALHTASNSHTGRLQLGWLRECLSALHSVCLPGRH